jgi:septation ring formation regulator EzrA
MEERKTLLLEGLLPTDVWNAIIVILILFGVAVALMKGITFIRDEIQKSRDKKKINTKDVTEEIADKVMEKLTPQIDEKFDKFSESFDQKFADIDAKLSADKETLTSHTTQLNDHESRVGKLEGGNFALCHGMLALLERDPSLEKEQKAMKNYLIDGKYKEDDWK